MTEKSKALWTWLARVVLLLATLLGIVAAAQQLPVEVRDYAALGTALISAAGAWIYSFLPAKAQPKDEVSP